MKSEKAGRATGAVAAFVKGEPVFFGNRLGVVEKFAASLGEVTVKLLGINPEDAEIRVVGFGELSRLEFAGAAA